MNWRLKSAKEAAFDGAMVGKWVGPCSLATAAVCGWIENRDAISPVNAVSHAVFGDTAFEQSTASVKYTMTSVALNDSACLSWATLFEWLFGDAADRGNLPVALMGGALVAGAAYITDYKIVPKRLTPGFERHLSCRSLAAVYAVLGLSMALASLMKRKR
ncbi:MAG: hypothetical protein JWN98_106 [Abditibacteriota bacterium]|nr:hypothetical protein [Abditibacteriota bacterium]